MTLNPQLKLVLDLAPLAAFFTAYKLYGLFAATTVIIVLTLLSLAIIYVVERRIALAPLITAIVVAIFGGLTLYLHDETFIKVKPTLVNLVFAAILLGGCAAKKGLLKHVFGSAFSLTPQGWLALSRRWGLFFLSMAVLNECVWRNVPTPIWVDFKVFGILGLTMVFAVAQTGFIRDNQEIKEE
ncbi:MAG TPA: septation protein A [Rickettsiales bacterium]|nr:septation protein A [Rickettsiales bacterium]